MINPDLQLDGRDILCALSVVFRVMSFDCRCCMLPLSNTNNDSDGAGQMLTQHYGIALVQVLCM